MSDHGGERYVVVSADCHAGAPLLGYREYLDAQFRDDFDRWAAEFVNPFEDLDEVYADRNWDSAKRLAHLEGDGIAAEVIFPNTVPPFFPRNGIVAGAPSAADYERRWAGLQARVVRGGVMKGCRRGAGRCRGRSCSRGPGSGR